MSRIERLKAQIRAQNNVRKYGGESSSMNPLYNTNGNEIVVLPTKPKKKRKLMEVQKEHKNTMDTIIPNQNNYSMGIPKRKEDEMDDEEVVEDDDGEEKPRHVPWGPAELLHHLDDPDKVTNINRVIQLVKQKELEVPVTDEEKRRGAKGEKRKEIIVWDHSKSDLGKKSDNNFFMWLEAYAAHEDKICQQQENMIFQ